MIETKYALRNKDTGLYMESAHFTSLEAMEKRGWRKNIVLFAKKENLISWIYLWHHEYPSLEIEEYQVRTTLTTGKTTIDKKAFENVALIETELDLAGDKSRARTVEKVLALLKKHKRYMVFIAIPSQISHAFQIRPLSYTHVLTASGTIALGVSSSAAQQNLPLQMPTYVEVDIAELKSQIKNIIKKTKITEFDDNNYNHECILVISSDILAEIVMLKLLLDGNLNQHYFDQEEQKFI